MSNTTTLAPESHNEIANINNNQDIIDFSLIMVNKNGKVSGRNLWKFLESNRQFADWMNQQIDHGFTEEIDFHKIVKPIGIRKSTEYLLTSEMAEHLCMMSKSEKGMQARKFYIECRKKATNNQNTLTNPTDIVRYALQQLEAKDKEIKYLEDKRPEANDQSIKNLTLRAAQTKTGIKALKEDIGAEINRLILKLTEDISDFRLKHVTMQGRYNREAPFGYLYTGAKNTSLDAKENYLKWLRELEKNNLNFKQLIICSQEQ